MKKQIQIKKILFLALAFLFAGSFDLTAKEMSKQKTDATAFLDTCLKAEIDERLKAESDINTKAKSGNLTEKEIEACLYKATIDNKAIIEDALARWLLTTFSKYSDSYANSFTLLTQKLASGKTYLTILATRKTMPELSIKIKSYESKDSQDVFKTIETLTDKVDNNFLHYAVASRLNDEIDALLDNHPSLATKQNCFKKTPLDLAVEMNQEETIKNFLKKFPTAATLEKVKNRKIFIFKPNQTKITIAEPKKSSLFTSVSNWFKKDKVSTPVKKKADETRATGSIQQEPSEKVAPVSRSTSPARSTKTNEQSQKKNLLQTFFSWFAKK